MGNKQANASTNMNIPKQNNYNPPETPKDVAYISTYNSLINMGFSDEISLGAALKHPNNINDAMKYIDNTGFIEIPIIIECKRNPDYCCNFTLSAPYNKKLKYGFTQLIKDIMEYIHQQYRPVKFFAKQICNDSFIEQELNDIDPNWYQWIEKITNYRENDVLQKGLHIFIEISKYEHTVNLSDITCNNLLFSDGNIQNDNKKFRCPIYAEMYYEYKFDNKHLHHLENYNHFRNEYSEKEQCKYGDECYAFKRLESGKNTVSDRCHVKLFRHPPRTRRIMTETKMDDNNPFCLNKGWYENQGLYKPTKEDEKEYDFNQKDGYLHALIKEVIDNGFKSDLCLTTEDVESDNYTILRAVDYKLKSGRHKQMGSPLNRAEMLSIILYTGCDANYDLCAKQRNGDYITWKWFDYCLYNAVSKLSKMEHGRYKIYTGLNNTKLNQKYIDSGYFKTYVSTSWIKSIALSFIEEKGMLIEIDEQFRENNICCDVSWISKFKDECEILIVRSVDAIFNNFECKIVDDTDGIQMISLSQYGAHKQATSLITKMNNMNIEDNIKEEDDEPDIIQQPVNAVKHVVDYEHDDDKENDDDDINGLDQDDKLLILKSGGQQPKTFEVQRKNAELSKFITTVLESDYEATTIEIGQVPPETLEHVVTYLNHHKGKEPDPLPCPVRSIHMKQIVSDKWDATFIDAFDKKTIFEIILAANYMDIKSLLHLGCAKIATLIKQLDQKEINRIIEEEEKYRREHAINKNNDNIV